MKIAIIGWGSLIWQPKELGFVKSFGWKVDGPILPLEYARISKDGRLTLVITSDGTSLPTLYTKSRYKTIDEAVLDLAVREGSGRKSIGVYNKKDDGFLHGDFAHKEEIKKWIINTDFDAVIWTNLGEKWDIGTGKIEPINRIGYLNRLCGPQRALAELYIRKSPLQIRTVFRKKIEDELGWLPIES